MEMKIDALAGTLESSDVMVRIGPANAAGHSAGNRQHCEAAVWRCD
jgi:citrate lyase acyl carrier protein